MTDPSEHDTTNFVTLMQQYVYDLDDMTNDAELDKLRHLAQLLLVRGHIGAELQKLSTHNSERVEQFGYLVGHADTNAVLLSGVLGAQVDTNKMYAFERGYIAGIVHNDVVVAIDKIHDAVADGQTVHAFYWFGNGVRIKDVPEDSLEKLVSTLLKCDSTSKYTALEMCARYYDKTEVILPRFIRNVLLHTYPPTDMPPGPFYSWKNLLVRYLRENPDDAGMISESIEQAIKYAPNHMVGESEWPYIVSVMLKHNPKATWDAVLHQVERNPIQTRTLLCGQRGVLNNENSLTVIQEWVAADKQKRSCLLALTLPNDLDTLAKWVSVCGVKGKAEVISNSLDNLLTGPIEMPYEKHYKGKIAEVEKVRDSTRDEDVLALLNWYESWLHGRLTDLLWFKTCERLGIGKYETPDEKMCRDELLKWLEAHNDITNMDKLIHKFNTELDGQRRQDGNVWHAELVKHFYEDGTFVVEAAESDETEKAERIDVDIKLNDSTNPDDIINIQAWVGMTKFGHYTRRMLNTGEVEKHDFDWDTEHDVLKHKIDQLPKHGQNFVVQNAPPTALRYMAIYRLLPAHVCVLQAYDAHIYAYYLPSFKYKETACRIAETMGKELVPMEGNWAKNPDWIKKMYLNW